MKVVIVPSEQIGSRVVVDRIETLIKYKKEPVLGFATGSSPEALYQELVNRRDRINWRWVTTFNLDEYVGLPPSHPESYRAFMDRQLFNLISINKDTQTYVPNGQLSDDEAAEVECFNYEQRIVERGGIDLQILGIGNNGHIAFNEPGSAFNSRTRMVPLDKSTRQANKRFFGDDITKVPTHAITMGMGTIMEAREIWLLAWGPKKAEAIARSVEGPVTTEVPASILQLHPNATVVVDLKAATNLKGSYTRVQVK